MELGFFSIITFPKILHEIGSLYESFGAFEGALDVYGRIVEHFSTYSKFSLVLYKQSVIMLHLSKKRGAPSEDLVKRTIVLASFLLEVSE